MMRARDAAARTASTSTPHHRRRRREPRRATPIDGRRTASRPHRQRVLRPDRMQLRPRFVRRARRHRAGAIGKPIPGHAVAIIGDDGRPLPPATLGEIAVRRPDPAMFLGYLATSRRRRAEKFVGDWMTTGDQGDRRRGRLCPLRRPRRRHHHLGRLPHRPERDRGLPRRPSGGGARRRRRQARSAAHRDRQGLSSC